jgi:PPOX class probable F420-dependent enzyme
VVRDPRERAWPAAVRGARQLAARRARHLPRTRVGDRARARPPARCPAARLTPEAARDFLRANHRAVLATFRSDGRPQLSPVGAGVDAAGRVIVSTPGTTAKARNLRRDPRVSVCAFSDGFYGGWVQVEGTAEIVEQPESVELLVDYYRRLAGEHPDWDEFRAAMVDEGRVLVRFTIERCSGLLA